MESQREENTAAAVSSSSEGIISPIKKEAQVKKSPMILQLYLQAQ